MSISHINATNVIFPCRQFEETFETQNGEKSNMCNQCDYASSQAGNLRTHLKTHSGEKSNKCNQCDYASSQAGTLRTHLKMHSGGKSNKPVLHCKSLQSPFELFWTAKHTYLPASDRKSDWMSDRMSDRITLDTWEYHF